MIKYCFLAALYAPPPHLTWLGSPENYACSNKQFQTMEECKTQAEIWWNEPAPYGRVGMPKDYACVGASIS